MQREVGRDLLTDAKTTWLEIFGRLTPGASLDRASAPAIAPRIATCSPDR